MPGGGATVVLSAAQCATFTIVAAAIPVAAIPVAVAATALAAAALAAAFAFAAAAAKLPRRQLLSCDADDTDLGE